MIAIIGGVPARFAPLVGLYREAARHAEADPAGLQVGINSHMYLAETAQRARDEFYPAYSQMMNRIGRERGWPPMSRAQFDAGCEPEGHLLVGTPGEVTAKILAHHALFDNARFLGHISVGVLPHDKAMRATELYATEVAPAVRAALNQAEPVGQR
jgi:alkanesulfonate monooxygenase SsuD/methylene tetrahydromethanopterin reductase-like flavin-dependent oxidoreductase (luciferase family)